MKYHLLLTGLFLLAVTGIAKADLIGTSDSIPNWSFGRPTSQRSGLPQRTQLGSTAEHPLIEDIIVEFQPAPDSQNILEAMGDNPEKALTERLCRWRLSNHETPAPETVNGSVALMDNLEVSDDLWNRNQSNAAMSKKSNDRLFPPRSGRRNTFLLR